jgi:hypothetical protein
VGGTIPERISWAVETLTIKGAERALEIGGGPDLAASTICERLDTGLMLLIDRSATAVERTRRRNADHVASGRLTLETVDLRDFEARDRRFDKVFAVNVNVFWTTQGNRRARARCVTPRRDALLFYETRAPSALARRPHESSKRCARTAYRT